MIINRIRRRFIADYIIAVVLMWLLVKTGRADDGNQDKPVNSTSIIYIVADAQIAGGLQRKKFTGTGVVITSEGHVLTVAHVLPDIIDPNLYKDVKITGVVGGKVGFVIPLERTGLLNKEADIIILKLPSTSAVSIVPAIVPKNGDAGVYQDDKVTILSFPLDLDLNVLHGRITSLNGDGGTWITDANVQEGSSGGPVFDQSGKLIGIVAGGYQAPGSSEPLGLNAIIPLSKARSLGAGLDWQVADRLYPGTQDLHGHVLVHDWSQDKSEFDRQPRPGETSIMYDTGRPSDEPSLVVDPQGAFELKCLEGSSDKQATIVAERPGPPLYVSRQQPATCGEDLSVGVTHPHRYTVTELTTGTSVFRTKLAPQLPTCMAAGRPTIAYLRCRQQNSGRMSDLETTIDEVMHHFSDAVYYAPDDQKPNAERQFGDFLVQLGQPCLAAEQLQTAATSSSREIGQKAVPEWLAAEVACPAEGGTDQGGYEGALLDLASGIASQDDQWVSGQAKPLLSAVAAISAHLSGPIILRSPALREAWTVLYSKLFVRMCSQPPVSGADDNEFSQSLLRIQVVNLESCRAS